MTGASGAEVETVTLTAAGLVGGGTREVSDGWERGRWWRVLGPDDDLWCETSDREEAEESMRPGDRLQRQWRREEDEWRDVEVSDG